MVQNTMQQFRSVTVIESNAIKNMKNVLVSADLQLMQYIKLQAAGLNFRRPETWKR